MERSEGQDASSATDEWTQNLWLESSPRRPRSRASRANCRWIRGFAVFAALAMVLTAFVALSPSVAAAPGDSSSPPAAAVTPPPESAWGSRSPTGVPLSDGSVRSTWVPTRSTLTARSTEPKVVRATDRFIFVTSFGNYSFLADSPYVMEYAAADDTPMVAWSAFLVGASYGGLPVPMVPTNASVVEVSNTGFQSSYAAAIGDAPQGNVTLTATFSRYAPPKFTAEFAQAPSSTVLFNIFWEIVPTLKFIETPGVSVQPIGSTSPESWVSNSSVTLALGADSPPSAWQNGLLVNWSDAGAGDLYAGRLAPLGADLGTGVTIVFPVNAAVIDPSFIAYSNQGATTSPSAERNTFYYDGFFWAFYDGGAGGDGYPTGIQAWSSPDGIMWTQAPSLGTGIIGYGFDVAQRGSKVAVAWITQAGNVLMVKTGTLIKGTVNWNAAVTAVSYSGSAGPAGVAIGADGNVWASAVWLNAGTYFAIWAESVDPSATGYVWSSVPGVGPGSPTMLKPLTMPDGSVMFLYSSASYGSICWLRWSGGGWSGVSCLPTDIATTGVAYQFVSAVVLPDGTIWASYPSAYGTQGGISALIISPTGGGSYQAVLPYSSQAPSAPTLGADDFGDLYLFYYLPGAIDFYVYYTMYSLAVQQWSAAQLLLDTGVARPPSGLNAGARASEQAFMIFAQAVGTSGPAEVEFASMPLPTTLGTSPSQPWSRDGISPYGTYFQQLSDFIAPGSGLLNVIQTDVQIPGRGLNLEISRVYSTPRTFLSVSGSPVPYLYEAFPDANLGTGWALNFPWIGDDLLHLRNGQSYRIKWDANGAFENHAGEQFNLYQVRGGRFGHLVGYQLVMGDGTSYNFTVWGEVTQIVDFAGVNAINFAYGSYGISTITDTVGRVVTFNYDANGRLQSLAWAGRTVQYSYDASGHLVQVLDPMGRATEFTYKSTNSWLLESVTYPTGGRTSYSYRTASLGTEATTNLVSLQNVYNGTDLVKSTSFSYEIVNGKPIYTKMAISDGSTLQGSTVYTFGSPANGLTTIASDAAGVQMRKTVQYYSPSGAATQQDVFMGAAQVKTYSTGQALDDWGNIIYTRDAAGQESFSSYANTNHANTFLGPGMVSTTSSGRIMSSNFDSHSLSDWTISSPGGANGWIGLSNALDPVNAPSIQVQTNSTSGSVSYARRSFPSQSGTFVAEGRIRTSSASREVFFLLLSGTGGYRVYFAFQDTNQMGWKGPSGSYTDIGSWIPNEWYKVAFVVDIVHGTYDIWINGAPRACSGCAYGPASLVGSGDIASLQLQSGYTGEYFVPIVSFGDDFKVTTSGALTVNGLASGSILEAVDTAGNVATATLAAGGPAVLNTLPIAAHESYLSVFNATGPIRDGNMEEGSLNPWPSAASGWNGIGFGAGIAPRTGARSLTISFMGSAVDGAYAEIYQDVAGFHSGDPIRLWFSVSPTTGNGGCTGAPNPDYLYVGLAASDYGTNNNFAYLAGQTVNVYQTGSRYVSLPYTQLVGLAPSASFRVHARIVLQRVSATCNVNVDFDDIDGPAEYTSPTTDFWGGDVYAYVPPAWRSGEFYAGSVPAAIHNKLVGSLSWQNGSQDPFLAYDMQTWSGGRSDLLQDLSGHGNDGELHGTASVAGFAGDARSFNGISDYVQAQDTSPLDPASDVTITAWLDLTTNPDCDANNNWRVILTKMTPAGGDWGSYNILLEETRGLSWSVVVGGVWQRLFSTGGVVPIGQWVHVAVVRSSAGFMGIYINGVLGPSQTSATGPIASQAGPLRIGAGTNLISCPNGDGAFPGVIDEVKFFNRALSSLEILQLASQVAWFDMETSKASGVLADMSGYQNAGTVTGASTVWGAIGKARQFNGVSDYVQTADSASLHSSFVTVSFWANWIGFPPADGTCGAGSSSTPVITDGNYLGPWWFELRADGSMNFYVTSSTGSRAAATYPAQTTGSWHQYTGTYDGSYLRIYRDGLPVGSPVALSGVLQSPTNGVSIAKGFGTGCGGKYTNAKIDEVRVYRRALSPTEVAGATSPVSTLPARTFYRYDVRGQNDETRTYHNGSWLYTTQALDDFGNVISATDVNARTISYSYSVTYQHAYLTSVTQGASTQTYAYDFGTGLVTSVTNARSYATAYTYDLLGRVTSKTQPPVGGVSPVTYYFYDDSHDILTLYDPNSLPRLFHYDMETLFNGAMEDLSGGGSFGTLHGTTSVTGRIGLARSFDGASNYIQASKSVSANSALTISAWVYRSAGQTDSLGDVLNANYVGQLKVSSTGVVYAQYFDGSSWRILTSKAKLSTSGWSHVAATFTPSGSNTIVNIYVNGARDQYSPSTQTGHPTGAYAPTVGAYSSSVERFKGSLDEVQLLGVDLTSTQVTSLYQGTMGGRYMKTYYDGLGRQVRSVQRSFFSGPSTNSYLPTLYSSNWQDKSASYTTPYGSTYLQAYDFLGRPTVLTEPYGWVRRTAYYDNNQTVMMWDEPGRGVQNVYDLGGRLTSVRQYYTGTAFYATSYVYDMAGDLIAVADPLGQVTRHTYDDARRLVQSTYSDGTTETFVYDNVGNMIAKTDQAARTLRYAYDDLDRVTTVTYPAGNVLRYIYDPNGNVLSVQNGTANLWLAYDPLDRAISRSLNIPGDANYTVSYGYDLVGNLLTLGYPDSLGTLTYTYDSFYRVTSMSFGGSTIASFTYRADGLLRSTSYGDGSLGTFTNDPRGFPMFNTVTAGATTLMNLSYLVNGAGDIIQILDHASSDVESFQYDNLDRIYIANGPWGSYTYSFDAAGNRLSMDWYGITTTYYKYGAYNQLCASSTSSGITCATPPSSSVTKYAYDPNGNFATRTSSTTIGYTFDLDNRLVKVCTDTPCTASNMYTFAYDGLGERIRETGPSGSQTYTNTYVASGDQMLYMKSVAGSTTTKTVYLYAGKSLVATISGTTKSYFHQDHLGNTRLVTQKSGSSVRVVFTTDYDPFGVDTGATGTDPNVKYTGQWFEAVGLYWNHARYYDPTLGRFVSQDPVLGSLQSPGTLNRYAYGMGNPLRYEDTNGRFLNIIVGAIAGGLIGWVSCGLMTGGGFFTSQCGIAAAAGAVGGAVAGATFNLALGLMVAEGATATLTATLVAGAISGAVAGAASYGTTGLLTERIEGKFDWSWAGLAESMFYGALGGAVGAGIGYKYFGAPTRLPYSSLWSLSATVGEEELWTVAGTTLFQNLVKKAAGEAVKDLLRRVFPSAIQAPSIETYGGDIGVTPIDAPPLPGFPSGAWLANLPTWYARGAN